MTEDQILRAIEVFKCKNQRKLATLLGISETNFSNRKGRGTLLKLVEAEAYRRALDVNYIMTGESKPSAIMEDAAPYGCTGSDAQENFSELMGMAGAVLNSGTIYAEALSQNIRAFHHGVNTEKDPDKKGHKMPGHLPGAAGGGRKRASGE